MTAAPCLVWFRQDLRLTDHPALSAARERGGAIIPVYIWAPEEEGGWAPGAASRYWLHQSLAAHEGELARCGSRLILRAGDAVEELGRMLHETGARAIFWNRRYEPAAARQEERLRARLSGENVELRDFPGNLLFEPDELRTKSGGPFQVFTPFYREALRRYHHEPPLGRPRRLKAPARWPRSLRLADLGLLPGVDWAGGIRAFWEFGERAAQKRLREFAAGAVDEYERLHDQVHQDGTSCLSPHLHFGEISPHQVWEAFQGEAWRGEGLRGGAPRRKASGGKSSRVAGLQPLQRAAPRPTSGGASAFLRQLIWREFAHHVLTHFPELPDQPLRPQFARLPWRKATRQIEAWQRGRTGYPLVDAAMRQLWETGWMHNRARMVVGSFLVKDLLVRWQEGEVWFWDTLVDGDLANNAFNWQWIAGCGADPAPFFRIFNPTLQGKKFDPEGEYVRRYVPELAGLSDNFIHEPWTAPADVRARAGVVLGKTYPEPIVDHAEARDRALMVLGRIKGT